MSLWGLAAGLLLLGPGLGAPELPGLLERGGAAMGLGLAAQSLAVPPTKPSTPPVEPTHVVLSPAEPTPYAWREVAVSFAPETRLWVLQGWPEQPPAAGETGLAAWREDLSEQIARGESRARTFAARARVIPVAAALERAAEAALAGDLPGITAPAAFYRAEGGLNDRGLYLVTMTVLASLSGKSPEGVTAKLARIWMSRDSVVTTAMAQALQDIAWTAASEAAAAPPEPGPDLAPMPSPASLGGVTAPGIGFNLGGLADWSPQFPFLDLMKTARRWTGHLPGQWGGFEAEALEEGGWLDPDGWPKRLPPGVTGLSTLLFTGLSPEAGGIAGRYHLRHQGRARLRLEGQIEILSQSPGQIVFDYRPGPGNVILTLSEIDPADPIRAITILREDRVALHAAGEIFNPDWLARLRGAEMLRFMDWMQTNESHVATPADQPRDSDYSYIRRGAPLSVMLRLAKELKADPWITLPHLAQDALVREMAETAHRDLPPGRKVYVEMSNEVWNLMFPQAQWAEAEGRARWGKEWAWVQFYALRAAEMAEIWREVFADDPSRLVRVIGTQTGWLGLERDILDAPLVVAEGRAPPHESFDALAVTGYVGGALGNDEKRELMTEFLARSRAAAEAEAARLGLSGRPAAAHVAAHRFDLAVRLALEEMRDGRHSGRPGDTLRRLMQEELPTLAAAAKARGLSLVMYEGGSHAAGSGASREIEEFTAFFETLNYTPGMGRLYRDLIDGWRGVSEAPFAAFVDLAAPSKYGSWGALRHLGDDNPRWRALAKGADE